MWDNWRARELMWEIFDLKSFGSHAFNAANEGSINPQYAFLSHPSLCSQSLMYCSEVPKKRTVRISS